MCCAQDCSCVCLSVPFTISMSELNFTARSERNAQKTDPKIVSNLIHFQSEALHIVKGSSLVTLVRSAD